MAQTTYHITGTTDELKKTLQKEFGMDENAAQVFVFLSLSEKKSDIPEINDDKTALWYLNEEEKYTAPVFRTRFSISFSQLKVDLAIGLAPVLGAFIFNEGLSISGAVLAALIALFQSTSHIQKQECCVYFQALDWQKKHPSSKLFSLQDIFPKAEEDICSHLEYIKSGKWECDYYHEEQCEVTRERFATLLDCLCEKNVFDKHDHLYSFKR